MREYKIIKIIFLSVLIIFSTSIASAVTINVPGDYATIQGAVDAIAVLEGSTTLSQPYIIIIAGGSYVENVLISGYDGNSITLQAGVGIPDINGSMVIEDDNVIIRPSKLKGIEIDAHP